MPGSSRPITWESEYSEDIGRSNFRAVALHVMQATPYVVAVPNLCLSYNKWGRPNPPYVVFRHGGERWQRISMAELPLEFKNINLVVATKVDEKIITGQNVVSAELVRQLNGTLDQPEYHRILRESVKPGLTLSLVNCEEMIYYKCGWISPHGEFGRRFMDRTCKK